MKQQKRKQVHKLINEEELLQDVYYTDENKTFEQVAKEIEGDLDKNIKETISRIKEQGLEKGIRRLCAAAIRENPEMEPKGIRKKVIDRVCPHIWLESSVRQYWPKWLVNKKISDNITARNLQKAQENSENIFRNAQDDLDRDEEQEPIKSYTMSEYEETHPEIAESPWEAIGEINRAIARLWTALTKQKNMPTREDDIKKDYLIPARARLQDIASGSSKTERIYLFNWLTWIIAAAKDARDIVEKADKTAYDRDE